MMNSPGSEKTRSDYVQLSDRSEFVQVGDMLYIEALEGDIAETSEKRLVCGDGAGAAGLKRSEIRASTRDFATHAVFIVQGHSTWTRLQAYKALLDRLGLDKLHGPSNSETRALYLEVEAERLQHERDFARTKGRDVRYGNVIQLLHESSAKYLSVSHHTCACPYMCIHMHASARELSTHRQPANSTAGSRNPSANPTPTAHPSLLTLQPR